MNENGFGNNGQYDSQQYGNGYQQQYNGSPSDSLQESLPDGVMERLPEWMRDKADDFIARANQEVRNMERYGRVEPYSYESHRHPLVKPVAMVIGFGGAFFFLFIKPNSMIALICVGIMLLIFGIGYLTDKNYCFRREPTYALIMVLGVIFILVAVYHILAKNIPSLPQPVDKGYEGWACGLLVVVGVGLLILDCISYCCMKKVCTEPVLAHCVYVKKKVTHSNKSMNTKYSGVFEYKFQGNTYLAAEPFRNTGAPKAGDWCELHINPDEPTDFFRKSWDVLILTLIGYTMFIGLPLAFYIVL